MVGRADRIRRQTGNFRQPHPLHGAHAGYAAENQNDHPSAFSRSHAPATAERRRSDPQSRRGRRRFRVVRARSFRTRHVRSRQQSVLPPLFTHPRLLRHGRTHSRGAVGRSDRRYGAPHDRRLPAGRAGRTLRLGLYRSPEHAGKRIPRGRRLVVQRRRRVLESRHPGYSRQCAGNLPGRLRHHRCRTLLRLV